MTNPVSHETAHLPSENVPARTASPVDDTQQQASTQPGDGTTAPHNTQNEIEPTAQPESPVDDQNTGAKTGGKLPFKEQVKAYAKIHRGTIFGNADEKQLGQQILNREVPPQ